MTQGTISYVIKKDFQHILYMLKVLSFCKSKAVYRNHTATGLTPGSVDCMEITTPF